MIPRLDAIALRVDTEANGIYLPPVMLDLEAQLLRHDGGEGVFLPRLDALVLDRLMKPVGLLVSPDELVAAAWPERAPVSAAEQVRAAAGRLDAVLRRLSGAELRVCGAPGEGWAVGPGRRIL